MSAPRRPGLFDNVSIGRWPPLHVNPRELDELIFLHGSSGELRRAMLCPCVRVETRQANAACQVCRGLGHVYPAELRCPMVFLDHSRSAQVKRQGPGALDDGTISITLPCGHVPGEGDMLLPDGEVSVVHEVFHRDLAQVSLQTLADRILLPDQQTRRLRPRPAALLYPTVTRLESVAWKRGEQLILAKPGIDYRLVAGTIEWLDGESPEGGEGFTVRYLAPAAYIVRGQAPLFRHEANAAVPWQAQAKRLDKIQRDADLR